ncbi:MAG TPA: hypothetical protein VM680_01225 [Verrucomicrobiae bacterium]|nr:hypothetical protein [Verrucomicrobiae bacterium]
MSEGGEKNNSGLSAEEIIGALSALSDELGRAGTKGEICLFGGAVMVLAFKARISTKDVDALFQPAQLIREAAARVGRERGLVLDWLNDGVKGFIASSPPLTAHGLPQFANLHVTMPTAEYLLAMKCMAGRTAVEGADDVPDIIFLSRQLGLKSSRDVLDIVARYYGRSGVPVKTQYLVEGLFDEGKV